MIDLVAVHLVWWIQQDEKTVKMFPFLSNRDMQYSQNIVELMNECLKRKKYNKKLKKR